MSLIRINRNPRKGQLTVFALAWLVILAVLGMEAWHHGRHTAAEVAWGLAAIVPVAGAARPGWLRLLYLGLSYTSYPIGFAVSHVALALVYYLALTPIGLTMRLFGHDPLNRRPDPKAQSYWVKKDGPKPVETYFEQS